MEVVYEQYLKLERPVVAKTIALYIMSGALTCSEGCGGITFAEAKSLFGVDLKNDREMLDMITDKIDRDILTSLDVIEDCEWQEDCIDVTFGLAFCPCAYDPDDPIWQD